MDVFADESGYTGENLFDRDQGVFVYASHNIPHDFCEELKSTCFPSLSGPIKHSKLRKSNIDGLLKALRMIFTSHADKVFIAVAEKKFVATAKIVDLIIEDIFHDSGADLYEDHAAKNYALMLFAYGNRHLGSAQFELLLQSFVSFIRRRDQDHFAAFSRQVDIASAIHGKVKELLSPVALWVRRQNGEIPSFGGRPLCLVTSDVILTMQRWSKKITDKYVLHCDSSNTLRDDIEHIKKAAYIEGVAQNEFGYGDKTFLHPTNCTEIILESDENSLEIQIADLLAGAMNCFTSYRLTGTEKHRKYAENIGGIVDAISIDFHLIQFTNKFEESKPTAPGVLNFEDFVGTLFPDYKK